MSGWNPRALVCYQIAPPPNALPCRERNAVEIKKLINVTNSRNRHFASLGRQQNFCRSLIQGPGCWQWQCCFKFRTVVRPSIWDKSSNIKIGQWGRPWLIWYVLCKRRCVPRFTILKPRHRHRNDRRWRCETHSVASQDSDSVTVSRWTARRYFHCLRWTITRITDKTLSNVLLQSLASIPQIFQPIFQINRPEITSHLIKPPKRKTVYSEPCHVLRGEKCPDASRMFALKYRVRRDLNTDVSVFDWHARLWLAPRRRLAVAKGLRENCRDVGRAPARKVYTVICHRSGQHYLKSDGPTYL